MATSAGSIRVFRAFGIDVRLHWSWALAAAYQVTMRSEYYQQPAWKLLEYVTLFALVLTHEFGHALACRSVGGTIGHILLWPFGGVARVRPPERPGAYLWSIAAGPLVNVVLLVPTIAAFIVVGEPSGDAARYVRAVTFINAGILVFNLLPVYPLDGEQILRGLLWLVLGARLSLLIASALGVLAGVAALVASLLWESWWTAALAFLGITYSLATFRLARAKPRTDVACPSCGAHPPAGRYWRCACRSSVDPFTNHGFCASCERAVDFVRCFRCGEQLPRARWHAEPQSAPPVAGPAPTA